MEYFILDNLKGGIIMNYYGGFQGNSCGCSGGMPYPAFGGYNYGGGYNNTSYYAIILVLFILLVIVIGSRFAN